METTISKQSNTMPIKVGLFTGVGLILYFIMMKLFNLHHHLELHYFNVLFLALGLFYAIKNTNRIAGEMKYFEGLKSGVVVSLISIILFSMFMVIYTTKIDPEFLLFLKDNIFLSPQSSSKQAAFELAGILTIEGLSSGFIITFILMQYYKNKTK